MKINNLYTDKQMRMPRDYQAINNDEMEYIDGGVSYRPIFNGAGYYVELNGEDCARQAAYLAIAGATIGGVIALLGGMPGAIAGMTANVVFAAGAGVMGIAAAKGGYYMQFRTGRLVSAGFLS